MPPRIDRLKPVLLLGDGVGQIDDELLSERWTGLFRTLARKSGCSTSQPFPAGPFAARRCRNFRCSARLVQARAERVNDFETAAERTSRPRGIRYAARGQRADRTLAKGLHRRPRAQLAQVSATDYAIGNCAVGVMVPRTPNRYARATSAVYSASEGNCSRVRIVPEVPLASLTIAQL